MGGELTAVRNVNVIITVDRSLGARLSKGSGGTWGH